MTIGINSNYESTNIAGGLAIQSGIVGSQIEFY
jgi:hypothetical protein